MHKLLLVDDNNKDIRIMLELIRFDELEIEIAGVATDGEEALSMIDKLLPDIVLSDICMPVMNGVEMAEILSKTHPEIKIVFISSYDDFTYAKSAIDLMICGYILKPLNPVEIEQTLKKVVLICDNEKNKKLEKEFLITQLEKSLPIIREEFLRDLLTGTMQSEEELRNHLKFLRFQSAEYAGAIICSMSVRKSPANIHRYDENKPLLNKPVEDLYLDSIAVMNILQQSKKNFTLQIIRKSNIEYVLMLFFEYDDMQTCMNHTLEYVMGIYNSLLYQVNLEAVFGISKFSQLAVDIPYQFTQAENAVNTKFYSNGNPVILFSEIEDIESEKFDDKIYLHDLQKEINDSIFMGEYNDIIKFIDKYLNNKHSVKREDYLKYLSYSIVNVLQLMLIQKGMSFDDIFGNEAAIWNKLIEFDSIVDLRQWLTNMIWAVKKSIEENNTNNQRNASIANTIKEYVHNCYAEPINVSDIALCVFLSPKQANSIFKKVTGKTIFDYLMEYRMEKAKQLLKESASKITTIAENVGYTNKSHFALMFKRHTGMTPAEYKNKPVL